MGTRRRGRAYCRLYGDILRTRKLTKLDDALFRWWINLLVIATDYDGEGEGMLPDSDSIAYRLNGGTTAEEVDAAINALIGHRLIDVDPDDGTYRMHDYREWQEGEAPEPAKAVKAKPRPRAAPAAALVPAAATVPGTTGRTDKNGKPLSRLQELVEAYADASGTPIEAITPQYGRYSKVFGGLAANGGYTYEDIYRLTGYVSTMAYWVEKGAAPPPESVVQQIGPWKARGKPLMWTAGTSPDSSRRGGIGAAMERR